MPWSTDAGLSNLSRLIFTDADFTVEAKTYPNDLGIARGVTGRSAGKYWFRAVLVAGAGNATVGVANATPTAQAIGQSTDSTGLIAAFGAIGYNNAYNGYLSGPPANGAEILFEVDMDGGTLFARDSVGLSSSSKPIPAGLIYPAFSGFDAGAKVTLHTGTSGALTPSPGYSPWE